jgi:hypothetical protein
VRNGGRQCASRPREAGVATPLGLLVVVGYLQDARRARRGL